jgi:lysophospholipase L1-like esterase
MNRLLLAFAFACCAAVGFAEEPNKPWAFDAALLKPFWLSPIMEGESVVFLKDGASAKPKASLLFPPTKILSVHNSAGNVTYAEGKDYVWKPSTREIVLPPGSKITFKTPRDLRWPSKPQHALPRRDGKGGVLHDEGHIYPDMQTIVTYEYAIGAWKGPKPSFDASRLPRTLEMLQKKKPLTIALLGDSISTGCNASAWLKIAPFQPAWQDLLVKNLETVYGSKIVLKNFAVGGTVSEWGLQNIGKVVDVKPDLVILAFGMNDAGSVPGAKYQANIRGMIDAVRKAQPQAEFILVATMRGNPDWAVQDLFPVYRDALAELCKPGIALADMTSIWTELLKHKKYVDITGNGVNHPNDFSHRIYAQVLSCLLIPGDLQATSK